jgi:hypothetical protein
VTGLVTRVCTRAIRSFVALPSWCHRKKVALALPFFVLHRGYICPSDPSQFRARCVTTGYGDTAFRPGFADRLSRLVRRCMGLQRLAIPAKVSLPRHAIPLHLSRYPLHYPLHSATPWNGLGRNLILVRESRDFSRPRLKLISRRVAVSIRVPSARNRQLKFQTSIGRMMVLMMDANYISERLGSMRQEIRDLRITTARYWSKDQHTALEKSAFALRKGRLLEIKREVSDMMKRCA